MTPPSEIRERLDKALKQARTRVGERLRERRSDPHAGAGFVRLLELLAVGASGRGGGLVYADVAGYGSEVTIEDLDSGEWFRHRLMTADGMDLEAGHVSTDSPLGAALLGRSAGDVVDVDTPRGRRRVCIARVETLPALLDWLERSSRRGTPRVSGRVMSDRREPRTGTHG
jgi:hypothetical protein